MLRLAVPVLHVASAKAARDFYCGKLGFRVLFEGRADPDRPDPSYVGLARDDAVLHISSFPGDGVAGGVAFIVVRDVDALSRELTERGVPIDLAPTDQTWGNREMYVKDPDGNSLRFAEQR